MEKIKHIYCNLCGDQIKDYNGWIIGHNAAPIVEGRCCDSCNLTKVLPRRMEDSQKLQQQNRQAMTARFS